MIAIKMQENSDPPQPSDPPVLESPGTNLGGRAKKPQIMVNSIVQALSILRFLVHSGESHGVTEIAREVGINPSSAFNIVKTLTAEKFLHFNERQKRYSLGPGALELAGVAVDYHKAFERIRDQLDNIVIQFGVTSAFWRLTNDERLVLVGLVDSKALMRIQMTVGQRIPAFSGAMGRCYAAALRIKDDVLHQKFEAVRWQQKPEFGSYLLEVQQAQGRGWATDKDQYIRGIVTVASVLMDPLGKPKFFIANSSFIGQLDSSRLEALGESSRLASIKAMEELYGQHHQSEG